MSKLNCPSCGGMIEGVSPLIRSIDCQYCGSWLRLNNQIWEANAGQQVALNAPSFLQVGMRGDLRSGESFKVLGRLRLQYDNDSWDEWWLEDGYGQGFWLEEDDGVYYRHAIQETLEANTALQSAAVAEQLTLTNGLRLFVTEKYDAVIVGRQGFLPNEPETSQRVTYIDGVADGTEYSLEVEGTEAYLSQSEVFDIHAIRWDKQ